MGGFFIGTDCVADDRWLGAPLIYQSSEREAFYIGVADIAINTIINGGTLREISCRGSRAIMCEKK